MSPGGRGARPVHVGQAGLCCVHCRDVPRPQRANQAVCYPSRLENLSESVRNFQRVHVDACPHIPLSIKSRHADAAGCRHRPRRSQKLVRAYCI